MLYSRFINLCETKGVAPSRVAQTLGYDKSTASYWKKASKKNNSINIGAEADAKMAEFFSVSVDYLNGKDLYTNDATMDSSIRQQNILNETMNNPYKMLLLDEAEGMSDKSLEQVIRMMRIIKGMQDD